MGTRKQNLQKKNQREILSLSIYIYRHNASNEKIDAPWQIERAQSMTMTTSTTRTAELVDEKKTAMLPRLAESLALKSRENW